MELAADACDDLSVVDVNGVVSKRRIDLSSASETNHLLSDAIVSVQQEISLFGDSISGCSVHQSLSVAELTALSLDADSDVLNGHFTVPLSSSCETDKLSEDSAVINLPSVTLGGSDVLDANTTVPESLHKALHAEGKRDLSGQQLSSLSQEANSLSYCSSNIGKSSSFMLEVEHDAKEATSSAELCELPPENIRWLYCDDACRQKKWLPFIGYDSLRIECKFRETRARLVTNNLSQGSTADELVIVRGGLYEVDVIQKTCVPIYWTREGVVCFV